MTAIERIGLEEIQELAEYFANLKVVDMKINKAGREIPQITWSSSQVLPRENEGSHNYMREP